MVNPVCASFFLGPALILSASLYRPSFLLFLFVGREITALLNDSSLVYIHISFVALVGDNYQYYIWALPSRFIHSILPLPSPVPAPPRDSSCLPCPDISVSSLLAPTLQPAIMMAAKEPRRCTRALRAGFSQFYSCSDAHSAVLPISSIRRNCSTAEGDPGRKGREKTEDTRGAPTSRVIGRRRGRRMERIANVWSLPLGRSPLLCTYPSQPEVDSRAAVATAEIEDEQQGGGRRDKDVAGGHVCSLPFDSVQRSFLEKAG
ncbi:hypothetical protein B0H14DRAFT_2652593 [Mycena olivaceomarginata]|nr:hypothetical protein B0H14DRAFT_2652593 [Mycena olivaceomarginata]